MTPSNKHFLSPCFTHTDIHSKTHSINVNYESMASQGGQPKKECMYLDILLVLVSHHYFILYITYNLVIYVS